MRVRTTNNRTVGFAYRPSQAEQGILISEGKSTEQAAEDQYYTVTPEGVELPEAVATYALSLYSTQMAVAGNDARETEEIVEETSTAPTEHVAPLVDISGEDAPVRVLCQVANCGIGFTAKTAPAAKGKLTRHMKKEHAA